MHTLAKVKNRDLADGDAPAMRVIGEQQVVAADRLVANTDDEAHELVDPTARTLTRSTWSTPESTSSSSPPGA